MGKLKGYDGPSISHIWCLGNPTKIEIIIGSIFYIGIIIFLIGVFLRLW